jgi:NADP-dependent 3-hydroxy acid dehydrogenase YdfG
MSSPERAVVPTVAGLFERNVAKPGGIMNGKVIVITGASAGIGAALAERVGRDRAAVALVGRREAALKETAGRAGTQTLPIVADVTVREDVRRAVHLTLERFGRIDVWVNNAGQGITRPPSELTDADIDLMMQVNVKSVLYGMQETLPHFKARGTGHVINISSELGRIPYAVHRSAYSAAKHFMNALTAMFRDEVQQTHPDIEYSIVSPGIVKTEFGVRAHHGGPDSRQFAQAQTAEEAAAVIADVIVTRRRDVYTRPDGHARVAAYYAGLA